LHCGSCIHPIATM